MVLGALHWSCAGPLCQHAPAGPQRLYRQCGTGLGRGDDVDGVGPGLSQHLGQAMVVGEAAPLGQLFRTGLLLVTAGH